MGCKDVIMDTDRGADVREIEAIIARQFNSLNWGPEKSADWQAFSSDFAPSALLYPAARPAKPQNVEAFIDRMKGLAEGSLGSFEEAVLGVRIRVFGNVAVAVAGCAMTENANQSNHCVEMMLLVKSEGRWQIVSQAWDSARPSLPLPADLLGP
jgi:hypothetical protein